MCKCTDDPEEVEGKETADLIVKDCRNVEDTFDNDTKYIGAITRSKKALKI